MLTVPGLCWLCRMPLALSGWGVCSVCTRSLDGRLAGCPQCGLPAVNRVIPCGRCLKKSPPWNALVAVDDYIPPLSGLIHKLKFSGQTALAPPLARLLLLAVLRARRTRALPKVDMVMNVPLYQRRHWRRGYNQSDLLCRPLARWLGCRYPGFALKRVQATAIQHQLSARQRKRNLKNAFLLELAVNGLHIAIVDDVVTTGSTVAELSRLLLRNGAASVQVWCLCRTL
ncbi:DNA utilization protein GntX [unidentified bacterial endosymbiont]|uniref:DNA utilization protein GntX n=1 Tax=unidentified bacterial endosymbiont TaxID=2355 RepID=UPI0020A23237|nr:DNA utilization protein GntX [unidentified bacterial endosymbiont]